MSTPIVEQIALEIVARINEITEANSFNQILNAVRPTRYGFTGDSAPIDLNVLVVQDDPQEDDEHAADGYQAMKAWVQPFMLVAFVINSDDSTAALDTRLNQVRADIEKKLMEDHTRGGLAWDTKMRGSQRFNSDVARTGITIAIDVMFRTDIADPYTAR